MRLLIYGMQSSGASTLAFLLAQKPGCAAFIDIWTHYVAPSLPGDGDVVAKVVVTTAFPLALHQERFQPDCTVLFLRHPEANYRSLATKTYRHHCGFMEEKFGILDRVFVEKSAFDATLYYEDLVFNPVGTLNAISELGWSCDPKVRMDREPQEIRKFNELRYPSIIGRLEYGTGNYRSGKLQPELANLRNLRGAHTASQRWCPVVTAHYRDLMRKNRRKKWSLPKRDKSARGRND